MDYYDISLCNSLLMAGGNPILITSNYLNVDSPVPFRILMFFKKLYSGSSTVIRGLKFLLYLLHSLFWVRQKKINLVHFHFFHFTLMEFTEVLLSTLLGLKIVVTVHDIHSFHGNDNQYLKKMIFKLIDRIIVHNPTCLTEIIRYNSGLSDICSIIRHGNFIDNIKTKSRQGSREYLGVNPDIPLVLFFGQIKKVKGLDVLLGAMKILVEENIRCKLLIAGKVWKDNFKMYQDYIHSNGLSDSVICNIRYIPNDEVHYYYHACDMVVLPYRNIYQSAVLLMAMSYGKLTIASDIPGMAEIITDGENGLLFNAGNSSSLAARIKEVIADPKMSSRIGCNGFHFVKDQYDWNISGLQTLELYQSMVKS